MSTATISKLEEKHYSVSEMAEHLNVSDDYMRRKLQNVPGVVRLTSPRLLGGTRKPNVILRVPASVAERLYEEWATVPAFGEVKRGRRGIK